MENSPEPGNTGTEGGFTLVEQLIAMSIMAGVLLSLLAVVGSGAAGVMNGRQRTLGTSLGKQVIERLQGAAYSAVAMNLGSPGLTADSRVTGTSPVLSFEGEQLVGGGSDPYKTVTTVSGTTYTVSTFVTAVTPASGLPYRRITVFVEWPATPAGTTRTLRFSSLTYPLDYTSFPAASGSAEVTGATASVTGSFNSDQFSDVHMDAPGSRATTSSATARTAQAAASSSTAVVSLLTGPLVAPLCNLSGASSQSADCPISSLIRTTDNDTTTNAPTSQGGTTGMYSSATVQTPGGLTLTTPGGTNDPKSTVDACASCGFGDADDLPWSTATSSTSTTSSLAFTNGPGGLAGSLWQMGSGWIASSAVDHDSTSGGTVSATAQLNAPAVKIFSLTGAGAFDAAVRVGAFMTSATANVNPTTPTPTVTAQTTTVDVWDDTVGGYRSLSIVPGTATDVTATGTVTVGGDVVTLTSRIQSQPKATSPSTASTGTAAAAQQPSILTLTVQATTTGPHAGTQTVVFDYGQVAARSGWRTS